MAVTTAQQLISLASIVLNDTENVRWTSDELLGWLNDGLRALVTLRPDQGSTSTVLSLAVGSEQSLPSGGLKLLDIIRNMGVSGLVPGTIVRETDRKMLDAVSPGWHASTVATDIANYCYDPITPTVFYVYPPSDGTGKIECIYAKMPGAISLSSTIPVNDRFSTALVNYMLYRSYAKDSEEASNAATAAGYYQLFKSEIEA
jgi:hypothetical protein